MPEPQARYTDRLRQSIVLASQEALRLRHAGVGPEHLLLGVVREGTGMGSAVLNNLGVDQRELVASLEEQFSAGSRAISETPALSADSKKALAGAADEADRLKSSWIGQEHLLLVLFSASPRLSKLFLGFHVTYELARAQAEAMLKPGKVKASVKRYNLALPEEMFRDVEQLAADEGVTVLEVLRRSVKLGLIVARAQQTPGTSFVIREGDRERQLVLL